VIANNYIAGVCYNNIKKYKNTAKLNCLVDKKKSINRNSSRDDFVICVRYEVNTKSPCIVCYLSVMPPCLTSHTPLM